MCRSMRNQSRSSKVPAEMPRRPGLSSVVWVTGVPQTGQNSIVSQPPSLVRPVLVRGHAAAQELHVGFVEVGHERERAAAAPLAPGAVADQPGLRLAP